MPDLTLGLTVAVIGMLGTLVALSVLAIIIALLMRVCPPESDAATQAPSKSSEHASA